MKTLRMTAAIGALLSFGSCLSAQEAPSYVRHVRPFLARYCLECHNHKSQKGGLDLESFKTMLEGSDKGPVLVPGKADQSKLVTLMEAKPQMPPASVRLRPKKQEIAMVRAWVAAGAKDDTGLVKVTIPDIKPHKAVMPPVATLTFLPSGKLLAAARYQTVFLLDGNTGSLIDAFAESAPISAMAVSANGKVLAVAVGMPGAPGSVHLYAVPPLAQPFPQGGDVKRWVKVAEYRDLHQDVILELAFNHDGKTLGTCSYDTRVKLIRLPSVAPPLTLPSPQEGEGITTLKEHSDAVYGLAFSHDNKLLATASADRAVKVWEVKSGKLLYTLGEATDWVYCVAWSPNGKHLAAGGVDKSIRVWEAGSSSGKLAHSVFAHEGPVVRLAFDDDGQRLYSLGQDRIIKAWDADRMVERKVFERLPEAGLVLTLRPGTQQLAAGLYDGSVLFIDGDSGKVQAAPKGVKLPKRQKDAPKKSTSAAALPAMDPFPTSKEAEPNNSPGVGQAITLPASITGSLQKAGDVDWFRFKVSKGQQLGMQVKPAGSAKLEPFLQLTDAQGRVLAEGTDLLGYTFAAAGTYAIGLRDREFRGGKDMDYRLHLGDIPIVSSIFPLGLQRGSEVDILLDGVFLGASKIRVKAPADAALGSKIPLKLTTPRGIPLGMSSPVVGEFPEVLTAQKLDQPAPPLAGVIPVPGTANGYLQFPQQTDRWRFSAKKGQKLIVEVEARRLGSALDSVIEILDAKGQPVPRATLRCLAKTNVTFRDHDSAVPNIRIDAWAELGVNDFIYVGSELLKIRSLPTHPDADCIFFSAAGQRTGYLDTTPTHLSNGTPMFKVAVHPPGMVFPPNGFPVITLYYRNDDGGPGYGRDSRIIFEAPADGDYFVKLGDTRGQGGDNYAYRLTVRPPRPSFNVSFNPTAPVVSRGGAVPITVSCERIDGYDGPIALRLENLPPGFHAPLSQIPAGENSTALALYCEQAATAPAPLKLVAHAVSGGQKIVKEVLGGSAKVIEPGDIVTTTDEPMVALKPGGTVKLTVHVERRHGFKGRIPLDVRGLPHGVKVLDIGLNGILITERESVRTIVIYAEPWVEPTEHPFVVLARREGKNTEHAAKSVLLRVMK